jgi:glycosyltransferase involved in cell wall biosynthesis
MKILLATETLHPGGAEAFVLRLSDALQHNGHQVTIFSFYKNYYNKGFHFANAPQSKVVHAKIPFTPFFQKLDGLFRRFNIDIGFIDFFIKYSLKKTMLTDAVDVIHSHLFKTDRLCLSVASKLGVPVIATMHGDYLHFFKNNRSGIPTSILNYSSKIKRNLDGLNQLVCISNEQMDFFRKEFTNETQNKLTKIYNGYHGVIPRENKILRARLGIESNHFVFGMVSRGIPSKGWQVAIDAFLLLNDPGCHLLLVGDSEYLQKLSLTYNHNKKIHFVGYSNNPLEWINIFDVGLLPSTYPSESLPTVVIEYIYCGKPVISSDAGELQNMLNYENYSAGIVIAAPNGIISLADFSKAMKSYRKNEKLYRSHKKNTNMCFSQFAMNKCLLSYLNIYKEVTNSNFPA